MHLESLLSRLDTMVAQKEEAQESSITVSFRIEKDYANTIKELAIEKGLQRSDIYKEIIFTFVNDLNQLNKNN